MQTPSTLAVIPSRPKTSTLAQKTTSVQHYPTTILAVTVTDLTSKHEQVEDRELVTSDIMPPRTQPLTLQRSSEWFMVVLTPDSIMLMVIIVYGVMRVSIAITRRFDINLLRDSVK